MGRSVHTMRVTHVLQRTTTEEFRIVVDIRDMDTERGDVALTVGQNYGARALAEARELRLPSLAGRQVSKKSVVWAGLTGCMELDRYDADPDKPPDILLAVTEHGLRVEGGRLLDELEVARAETETEDV